jgi:hypothetical protein
MKGPVIALVAAATFIVGVAVPTFAAERHPEMREALNALFHARTELQQSAHDFHGLRARALSETDAAIHDVQAAMTSDR